jgi:hypothetical protein
MPVQRRLLHGRAGAVGQPVEQDDDREREQRAADQRAAAKA